MRKIDIAVLAAAALSVLLALAWAPHARPASARAAPPTPIYWGAWIDGDVYGREDAPWDAGTLAEFERHTGKHVSIIHFGQPWQWCNDNGCTFAPFMTDAMGLTRRHGSIPMVTWGSWAHSNGSNQPDFRLSEIAKGRYDEYIRSWALAARKWGHPFFLRLDHEMNIACCWPWAEQLNGNSPGDYVAMWRHVHDIFKAVGASNATWVWCPNREYAGSAKPLSSMYPGNAYVDWTCLDAYNWGTNPAGGAPGWSSFDHLLGPTYRLIAQKIAPKKPMLIGETASSEDGGSKAAWIGQALSHLRTHYPKVKAFLWFNAHADGMDWPVETSSAATQAFRKGIVKASFSGASFGKLRGGAIKPLAGSSG